MILIRDYTKFKSNPLHQFWIQYPALYYGISFLIGVYASFYSFWSLFFIIGLFWFPLLPPISPLKALPTFFCGLLLCLCAFFYTSKMVNHPNFQDQESQGTALFHITALTNSSSFIGKSWNYSGKMIYFEPENSEFLPHMNIPATVVLAQTSIKRPLADGNYLLRGQLKKTKNGQYIFFPEKNSPWKLLSSSWSLAEWRFKAKQKVNQYLMQKYPNEPSGNFLAGIVTGEFENRLLSFEFSRFGLQHIMAISGFHFSIVAGILGFILSCFAGRKLALMILMLFMTAYFIFLGTAPSIMRAWMSCIIAFSGFLFEKQPSSLNSLGAGLLVVLIFDPEMARHIGFQFSFAVTAGILLLYSPIDSCLQTIMPKKTLSTVIKMNSLNQHGFIIFILFRQALALTIAVNLVAIPITLYYFQKFPVLSLVYNLFFPLMVSISMLLLIFGLSFDVICQFIGNIFHRVNEYFTHFVLDYTYHMPRYVDVSLNLSISSETIVVFLSCYFTFAIYIQNKTLKTNTV